MDEDRASTPNTPGPPNPMPTPFFASLERAAARGAQSRCIGIVVPPWVRRTRVISWGHPALTLASAQTVLGYRQEMQNDTTSIEASGAFVTPMLLKPHQDGVLDGLTFSVKDNIDIAGYKTSFGSLAWRERHPVARKTALCVDQLLAAGATCVGKVVADEFTYSLQGESPHWGTPLNARAPDRVPGGSSSGSASSVSCGLADFSLGTDAGGSARVPASFTGTWGMRPSLHRISEAGVLPFMPSVSTVAAFASDHRILDRAMRVLLRSGTEPVRPPRRVLMLEDAFELADADVRAAAVRFIDGLSMPPGVSFERVRFSDIVGLDMELRGCNEDALRDLQTAEFENTVGEWVESHEPDLGPAFRMAYGNVQSFDRIAALESIARCERLFRRIQSFLQPGIVVCFPTTPTIAPLKGSLNSLEVVRDFYDRTMAITAFSGVGRLPEISAPVLSVGGCPVGLSIVAGHYQDEALLDVAGVLFAAALQA